jgi:nitronate monooxygenase
VPSTALCRDLGIEHPIFSVGFGAGARAELAGAVSKAGGLGVLGSTVPLDELGNQIARVREVTDRPFGVNFIIAVYEPEELRERVDFVLAQHVPLIVFFAGDPSPYVDDAHAAGTRVFIQVGSPAEAETVVESGVDGVIAQGFEAGGHVIARHSLFVNLPTIVDAAGTVPVLASGGIADGRGLAAALCLGAQGVSLGTRFVASDEAFAHEEFKRRVVASSAEDTVYSEFLYGLFWDAPHRALKTRGYDEWVAAGRPSTRPGEGETIGVLRAPWGDSDIPRWAPIMVSPWFDGDIELAPMWAGESVALVHEIKPAGQIVHDIAREADEVLARL